jgi:hypothetical protein
MQRLVGAIGDGGSRIGVGRGLQRQRWKRGGAGALCDGGCCRRWGSDGSSDSSGSRRFIELQALQIVEQRAHGWLQRVSLGYW